MRKTLVLIIVILCSLDLFSQDSSISTTADTNVQTFNIRKPRVQRPAVIPKDSILTNDTTAATSIVRQDSTLLSVKINRPGIIFFKPRGDSSILLINPFFRFKNPMRYSITIKKWQGKEAIFYSIIALLIFFALIKNGFSRYMTDLFKTYFRTAVNQKQAKEQLIQNPLPSLLLNLFFVFSIGMFLPLLLQHFKLALDFNFWWLYLYCMLGLMAIYAVKFVSLKFFGWIFQVTESTDAYIFIVFTTNKIIGICLLPFLVMLAFTYGLVNEAAMSLSIMVVFALIVYRFFLSYVSIRKQIRISFFHFLLYLFAFEVIPLLLINKLLFRFLGETY